MKTEDDSQAAASNPAQDQGTAKGRLSSKKVSVSEKTPEYLAQRFQGDGVRYKAKLIGVDDVAGAQGDKMCLDSMMKLKGLEVAARQRGLHKQRVWLKVSDTCVRIIDEKAGAVEHQHELKRINSVKKDDSQPRAFSYIYEHEGTFKLFFIKMANLADPVIEDIKDACQIASGERSATLSPQQQNGPSLLLDEHVAVPQKGLDIIDLFNPVSSSPAQLPESVGPGHTSGEIELNSLFSDFNGTSVPANPTLDFNKAGSSLPAPWASCSTAGFFGPSAMASPFNLPSATSWGPAGQASAPSPGSLGPWGPAGQASAPSPGSLGPWVPAGQANAPSPGSLGSWVPAGQVSAPSPGSLGPWGPEGQPSAPSPGSLGPWGPAGSWDQQQTVPGWIQPCIGPHGMWAGPARPMGQATAGFFTTAGHICSGEMMFPQLTVASASHQDAGLQRHSAEAGLHPVSNVFNSRPFDK